MFCGPRAALVRMTAVPSAEQPGQPVDRADRLVRRHADDERQLDGVDVAEPGDVALVEQGAGERLVGPLGEAVEDLVEVRLLGAAQVGAEVADDAVLLGRRHDAEHRHVEAGQPAVLHPQLDRRRHAGSVAAGPTRNEPSMRRWAYSVRPSSKRISRCLPWASASLQHGAGEVDADEARVARDAALARAGRRSGG